MTPVQAAAIPLFLDRKDIAAEAVTGSGKTLAFVIPVVEILRKVALKKHQVGALIVSPTRELAAQIGDVLSPFVDKLPNVSQQLFIGGNNIRNDVERFESCGANIVVGTPGRIEELLGAKTSFCRQSFAQAVKSLEVLILDEGDRLLSLGFERSLNTIFASLPKQRRTGLFSATQTKDLDKLVRAGLRNPVLVSVKDKQGAAGSTPASLENFYFICEADQKFSHLVQLLRDQGPSEKCLLFFSTCAAVEYFSLCLKRLLKGHTIFSIHGKKEKRHKVFESFKKSKSGLLVCTDVMARGVDIPDVSWVLQFDPPSNAEAFVHRCGRTARIGRQGKALLFLLPTEEAYVEFIRINQKAIGLRPFQGQEVKVSTLLAQLRDWQKNDRTVFDLANRAFVSHIQAYTKHECKYILRLKDLPFGKVATCFGLLRMPKMPELRKVNIIGFDKANFDVNGIKYRDKKKEESRQEKLAAFKETGHWPGLKSRQVGKVAWSDKVEKRAKKADRKRKKEAKKTELTNVVDDGDDIDDLEEDYKLVKKLRKGKKLMDAFDKQIDLANVEDVM